MGVKKVCYGFLRNKCWAEKSGPEALAWILKLNNLDKAGTFEIRKYEETPKGVYCAFEASDELEKALDKVGPVLNAGICSFTVHKRMVKAGGSANGK